MRNSCLLLALLGPAFAWAQQPHPTPASYPYHLRGQLGTLDAPAKVYLVRGEEQLDSATLHHGRFELRGTTPQPVTATLVLERAGHLRTKVPYEKLVAGKLRRWYGESPDRLYLFLEPGPVVMTSADSLRKARLKGGSLTTDFQQHEAALKPLQDKLSQAVIDNMERGGPRPDFKAHHEAVAQLDQAFIKAHPASWVSFEVLQQQPVLTPTTITGPLYAALSPALRQSVAGQQYAQQLAKQQVTAVGAQAPDFQQPTPDGQLVKLSDYRGKYVLVDFWASWCKPCRAENPNVLKAYEAYKHRNFEVLSISIDDARAKWLQAVADDHLPWTQVADLHGPQNEAAQRYNVNAIPQNFLIDPTGRIVASNLSGEDLVAQLAPYLK
jgi:peroxiredoxin